MVVWPFTTPVSCIVDNATRESVLGALGDAYAAVGENKTAIENYKKALKIDPAN